MSNTREVAEKLTEGWTLEDKIEELKGKYHLRKKDWESYWEQSKLEIRTNEQIISSLRSANKAKRILLAADENADERVIQTVFKEDRTERLALQRFTASGAIDEMDQRVCEKAKFLNAIKYEKEKREQKLSELNQELARMHHMEKKSPEVLESEHTTTQLENSLDKAQIKYDTARIITQRYGDILDRLKEESLTLPAKLDTMEQALRQQQTELSELRELSREASQARDQAKAELSVVEQAAYESRRQREVELNATRKEVERRKTEAEKVDKKSARATLISDQSDQKALQETQQKLEAQNRVLLYEELMERIKLAAHVTDMDSVVGRIQTQKGTQARLRGRVQELEGLRNRLHEEVEKLKAGYHDMKYSGEHKVSCGQARLEDLARRTETDHRTLTKQDAVLKRNGDILVSVRTGVATLIEKLTPITLPPPHHNYTQGDIYDKLGLVTNKISQLLTKVGDTAPRPSDLQGPDFTEFLETQLAADNVRVQTTVSDTALSEFDFDGQENVVLGRTDIKSIGQKLIDSKQKPKKKRSKKK